MILVATSACSPDLELLWVEACMLTLGRQLVRFSFPPVTELKVHLVEHLKLLVARGLMLTRQVALSN
jgi:hypothetical protein